MRYSIVAFIFLNILMTSKLVCAMNIFNLDVKIECGGDQVCIYAGQDVTARVTVGNSTAVEAMLPLKLYLRQGPIVELRDNLSGKSIFLRRTLADRSIARDVAVLRPGATLQFDITIPVEDIEKFRLGSIDLNATVSLEMRDPTVSLEGAVIYRGSSSVRLRSKNQE